MNIGTLKLAHHRGTNRNYKYKDGGKSFTLKGDSAGGSSRGGKKHR